MAPTIIPIFLPNLGCRHRCIFCNQEAVAPEVPSPAHVRKFIRTSLNQFSSDEYRERQIAFYGGSFTAIPKEDQRSYLKEVHPFLSSGMVDSIRISTRPDALDEEILSLLKEYGVKTVEVGAQSMIDEVLLLSHRGHATKDTISAVSRLKHRGFEVGLHLMIGLPGDSLDRFLQTLDQVIDLNPDFLRIHPALVLKGAPLETLWREGKYSPLTLEEAIQWLKKGLLKIEKASISVARIGLQTTKDLENLYLAGPHHSALHQLVDSEIYLDMATRLFETHPNGSEPVLFCHPGDISNVRGQRNTNIQKLRGHPGVKRIKVQGREDIPRGFLVLQTESGEISTQRNDLFFPYPIKAK
jgi:histone acetyltransferase (RNA polymerase elongator complex component)